MPSRRLLALLAVTVLAGPPAVASAEPIPGAYIVTLRDGDPAAAAQRAERRHGATVDHVYTQTVRGYAARMSARAAQEIAGEADVASVVADQRVQADAQVLPTGVDRADADLSPTAAIDGVDVRVNADVAVLDTGIDLGHPDLKVAGGKNCQSGKSYGDGNGHGTHVAGTIAALDNGIGVVGVAPGARLWAVRVLNNAGSGSWSSIICGIDWVTGMRATIDVANMSLGGTGRDSACTTADPLHLALCRSTSAGVTYAVAAGNEADDAANHVPAAYDEVITVSALADFDGRAGGLGAATCRSDADDTFASFSNFGADVDLIAPGVCIRSTWKGGGYNTISGTSMATPHVTGAAALHRARNPAATPSQVKGALQAAGTTAWSATDDPDGVQERLLAAGGF